MKRLIRYLALGAGVGFVTLVLSVTSARPALAQLAQPTHQAILDAINSLSSSVTSALTGIQSSLNTLAAEGQSNVRVTPPLDGSALRCGVVNVSDTAKTVASQLWSLSPHQLRVSQTAALNPGEASEIRFAIPGPYYCVFTVQDGSKSDIRGSIMGEDFNGALTSALSAE